MTTEDRTATDNRRPMGNEDVAGWSRADEDGELDEQRQAVDADDVDEARRVDLERDRADGLDATDGRQDTMDGRQDTMDGRQDTMDGRQDTMGGRQDMMDDRRDTVAGGQDVINDRGDAIDDQDAIVEHPDAFQPSGEESHDVEFAGAGGSVDEAEQVDLDDRTGEPRQYDQPVQSMDEVSGLESPRQPMDDAAAAEPSPLFDDGELDEFRTRWTELQGAFVDDPKVAVEEADELVNDLVQTLTDRFSRNKHELEGQWQRDGSADTEDLRLALRRYRSFFDQLLRA